MLILFFKKATDYARWQEINRTRHLELTPLYCKQAMLYNFICNSTNKTAASSVKNSLNLSICGMKFFAENLPCFMELQHKYGTLISKWIFLTGFSQNGIT